MLKTYEKYIGFTLDGELVEDCYKFVVSEEDEAICTQKEWCGLENIKQAVTVDFEGTISYRYSLFRKQLGLMGCGWVFLRVKENSTLKLVIKYKEVDLSLNELFRIKDGKRVIDYMKQQGITICPMKA